MEFVRSASSSYKKEIAVEILEKSNISEDTRTKYVECLKTIFTNVHIKMKESLEMETFNEYITTIKELSSSSNFKHIDKFKFMDILELFE